MTPISPARPAANAVTRRGAAALPGAAENPPQHLIFVLGGEMFTVGILNVKEIIVLI
ncbi:MAG: hypothetical protein NFW16_17775 [Candidatus Accumulibacter sp.]|uniref:hypothetical protein n=1 Tax=Accumulibacter sp. TaxID=2053492 RepID=UPI0004528697|nr:hypothetical protein [Accumulibacter sp.]MCM8623529.1 hypothetical protein [Accumulibacter sp.]